MNCRNSAAVGLLLLACVLPLAATAMKGGPSAEGSVRLSGDGVNDSIEFSAATDEDGNATGQMTFAESASARRGISFSAALDCLSVVNNKAVMSGVVTQSTPAGYAGRRVVLVVLDNGDGEGAGRRDRLTWGVYGQSERNWLASDAEVENDPGAGRTWIATDAERADDEGEPSDKVEATTCKNIPLSAFSLVELKQGEGDIRVRQ